MTITTSLRYAATVVTSAVIVSVQPAFARLPVSPVPRHTTRTSAKSNAAPVPSDAELDRFAHAVVDVGNIKRAAQPGIRAALTPADRAVLERVTVKRIKAAIRDNHLSVHRYMQIVAYVEAHPAEQEQVVALMKQLMPPLPPQQALPAAGNQGH